MSRDSLDALNDALNALDEHLRESDATARRSERNRLTLLHVHAGAAVLIAPLFALTGAGGMRGPSWAVLHNIPGAPYSLAALLAAGGIILGVATWHRHITWELVGLWTLMCWYGLIGLSFAAAVAVWMVAGMPDARPAIYAPAVYAHILVVLWVHRTTLGRIRRMRRSAGQPR